MANKLRNVFNKKNDYIKGNVRFKDEKASKEFQKALETVYEEGKFVRVSGVESMSIRVESGAGAFPLDKHENVSDVVVGPSAEEINLDLEIDGERIEFPVGMYAYKKGSKIRTKENFVFCTEIAIDENTGMATVKIKPSLDKASNVDDVLRSIRIEIEFLKRFFNFDKTKGTEFEFTVSHFYNLYNLFEKLSYIEKTFERKFDLASLDLDDNESIKDLIELCLHVRENKVVRVYAKMTDSTGERLKILTDEPIEGRDISLTFVTGIEYSLWDEKIELHCASLLCNAIVKEIEELEDGQFRIIYGEKDDNPMYVSYRGFINLEDAKTEHSLIMEHKKDYVEAKTVEQYIDEGY